MVGVKERMVNHASFYFYSDEESKFFIRLQQEQQTKKMKYQFQILGVIGINNF